MEKNRNKYSVIVFDLGNVLIPFNYQATINNLNLIDPGLGQKFIDFYKSHYELHRSHERGDITSENFINRMLSVLDNKLDKETFCQFFSNIFTENRDVISLLPVLKEKYQLVLMSNTNLIHYDYGWKKYDFIKYFDKLILSHEVHAVKPEPAIYKAVESFTGRPPQEHIFIDDIPEYTDAAKKLGWDAICFIGYDNLVKELSERGII